MYILNVRKKVLGVIISFEVASQRPPILFLPVDGVLVDCYLCFAHHWKGMAPTYKQGDVLVIQFPPEMAESWWRYGGELVTK